MPPSKGLVEGLFRSSAVGATKTRDKLEIGLSCQSGNISKGECENRPLTYEYVREAVYRLHTT